MVNEMVISSANGPIFLQFPGLLQFPELFHGVFTRKGGVSEGPFKSLNSSLGVGDRPQHVEENRRRMTGRCHGLMPVFPKQVHGKSVYVLLGEKTEALPHHRSSRFEADAVVTGTPGVALGIQVADCQPVILYDPVKRIVANVHSGWRGSIENILSVTLAAMREGFGSAPKNIHAGIGPSLGPCCAEFVNFRDEIPKRYWAYKDSRDHFDFWSISRDQLAAEGVKTENIYTSGLCTRCRTDLFFSYRGEGTTGRFAALAGVRPPLLRFIA